MLSGLHNPGTLPDMERPSILLTYRSAFLPLTTGEAGLLFAVPIRPGGFGIDLRYRGNAWYGELETGVAYGIEIAGRVGIGTGFRYYQIRAEGYPTLHRAALIAGLLYRITDYVSAGVAVFHPLGVRRDEAMQDLAEYRAGLQWTPHEDIVLTADLSKGLTRPAEGSFSLTWRVLPACTMYTGFSALPFRAAAGISWQRKEIWTFSTGTTVSLPLGWRASCSIRIDLPKKSTDGN